MPGSERRRHGWLPTAVLLVVVLVMAIALSRTGLPGPARTVISVLVGVVAAGVTQVMVGRSGRA